ncbi:MAG: diaminopimelate decarboxylase [Bacteroidales bacterium]|nr:diaminopimelate decarboxylase [Bacteroidales bacterium]HOK99741.1 diaminopimelate decarboxylase [Bacteroidales bacterium]HPO65982.1 diaminopimelate decarboxylase [Bacteroidales bacterium]
MSEKKLTIAEDVIRRSVEQFPTPFHLYDEKAIRDNARELIKAFSWNKGFKEYFAVKATPNPVIVKMLKDEGFGADCSSLPEMVLANRVGIKGEDIMFTSNDTPAEEFKKARELGAIINLDDIKHFDYLAKHAGLPDLICFRYNPGPLKEGNVIIGHPEEAKYGLTYDQLFEAYRMAKASGIKRFGLHTMVASNELNPSYFFETAELLFDLVIKIWKEVGITFEFVNLGGGIGIPYRPGEAPLSWKVLSVGIQEKYEQIIKANGHPDLKIFLESGRAITGPYGYLVARVLHIKDTYKKYAGLDASMHNLMRPAMYGAYHHITVIGKQHLPHNVMYDVTGSLCENNDKFAIDRLLPELEPGDIVVIHDTGAHGHAMGFNYNAKLRSAEILLRPDGSLVQIRRAETIDDYFATVSFEQANSFQ